MPVFLLLLAGIIEFGQAFRVEHSLSNAARRGARAAIVKGATSSGVTAQDVEIGVWDETTAAFTPVPETSSIVPNAVQVTCRRVATRNNALGLFFAPIFGTKSADLRASAIARIKTSRCGLIIGLTSVSMSGGSHTNSYKSANGPYSSGTAGNNGTVCSNGGISMSGSSGIYGDAHPGPGKTVTSSSSVGVVGTISPLSTPLSYPATDPGDASSNNNNGQIPLSAQSKQPLNSKGEFQTSRPGCESGRPELFVPTPVQDPGQVAVQGELSVPFPVRNHGTVRLVINQLQPGCNYSDQASAGVMIPPGGSATILVKLDARVRSGLAESGSVYPYNDPLTPPFRLMASARVTEK